jgi:hypothetical protein
MMSDLDALARLSDRVESLERRIAALEHAPQLQPSAPIDHSNAPTAVRAEFAASEASGVFPVFGKAMLGIAGAYLLRAIAESGSFPKIAVVGLALAYAAMWLVWAARVPVEAGLARAVYAATSAMILSPMLWELTLRFQFVPSSMAAALLTAFAVAAAILSWQRNLAALMWVAVLSAVLSSMGLLIASRDPVPFVCALLVMAGAVEIAAFHGRTPALRPFVALAVDLATCITFYIYSSPETARASYAGIDIGILPLLAAALFTIYGASVSLRVVLLRRRISTFDIMQVTIAFSCAAAGVLLFVPAGERILGLACILLAAATYVMTFLFFDREPQVRNYHVYATWSVLLLSAGAFLTLPTIYLALGLSAVAIVATVIGCRTGHLVLEFHGVVYLGGAAFASGLLTYAGLALAGTFPAAPGWLVWSVAVAAVICYAIGGSYRGESWPYRLLELMSAVLAVSAALTFFVSLLVWVAALGMVLSPAHVAVIRTMITCAVALALSFSGSRWQRIELMWLAYGMLALVTAKLLFEDMRHGQPALIAVSIFLYAIALIMISRAARWGARREKVSEASVPDGLTSAAGK